MNKKWVDHISYMEGQMYNMWSLIHYNTFIDKTVNELKNQVKELTEENIKVKMLRDCEDCPPPKKVKIAPIKTIINLLKDEYTKKYSKKPSKKYYFLSESKKKDLATSIYKTLNTIEDIIKLKTHPLKYDFINDTKFTKLYNVIPTLEDLHGIIGMDNVKEKLFNSICYFLHSMNNKDEMNHVMIMGPPGTGKTTIAKIIGDLYLKLGFLENNNFIIAKRSDLIAKYLGQTAIKTQAVIDSAMGGVLFIDEVYSLGNSEKRDSFAKECIDTINLNMSRTDAPWLLIVGGYKDEIEKDFLAYNKGLERRFTVKLEINDYTSDELFNILMKFVKEEKWDIDIDAITPEDIKNNIASFKYFAGDMRKLLQLAKENYSTRQMKETISLDLLEKKYLKREDFTKSLEQFVKKENDDKYYNSSMYS